MTCLEVLRAINRGLKRLCKMVTKKLALMGAKLRLRNEREFQILNFRTLTSSLRTTSIIPRIDLGADGVLKAAELVNNTDLVIANTISP